MVHAGSHVTEDSNQALVYAENFLIARHDPALLENTEESRGIQLDEHSSISDEREVALRYLVRICPAGINIKFAQMLFSKFAREVYFRDDYLWRQGSQSTSIKLLVRGSLLSVLENEAGTEEIVRPGNLLGELGVIEDVPRFSSVQCLSDEAIVYSLIREDYHELVRSCPQAARLIELICIRYLSARVQHISNRVFETRCLPI
jgi:SulP family sulfate permease